MMNKILDARENKAEQIKALFKQNTTMISIKANIPGEDKNISEAHLLVRLFTLLVRKKYEINHFQYIESADGPYTLLIIKEIHANEIKQEMVLLENTHPLGRFIDIDIYNQEEQSISRKTLGIPSRKCYICGSDAHLCSRSQKHSVLSLIDFIQSGIKSHLAYQIEHKIHDAIMKELNLDDKFGLVSKTSKGSHSDMDYQLMKNAEYAILPFLVDLFLLGYETKDLDSILSKARPIGRIAEEKMLQATHGVNAYKGLIYIFGLTLLSLGYALSHHQEFMSIFLNIESMTKSVYDEFRQEPSTSGLKAYKNYNITGIRGEVHKGMPSVISALELLSNDDEMTLRQVLKHLIIVSEDTVFLKRAKNIENYHRIKEKLKKIDITDPTKLQEFNQMAIQENLSFGGSADLLIVTIFLKSIKSEYFK